MKPAPPTPDEESSPRRILVTGALLVILALVSLGLSDEPLGRFAIVAALVIAAVKATLVAWEFMRLRAAPASIQLAAMTAVLMVLLLVVFAAADVTTRETSRPVPDPTGPALPP